MPEHSEKVLKVVVQPLDGKRESLGLLGAIAAICLLVAFRVYFLQNDSALLFLQPYHRLDTTLSDKERVLHQTLLASEKEIIYLWQENRQLGVGGNKGWPTAESLAAEGIPPFATDLVPPLLKNYTWTTHDRGPWVDYLGHDRKAPMEGPSALLRIIDLHADFHPHPHPGKDYDPEQKAAVQVWMHKKNNQRYAGMQLQERGWSWIISPNDPILTISPENYREAR